MIEHYAGKNANPGLRVIQWRPRSARRAAAEQRARRTSVATHRAAGAAVRVQPARGVPDGGQHIRLEGQARPAAVDER
jgi:hypothetical protein